MEKILKKYTTIPQHLYVRRNADEQLQRIIEEMQRPGYVLVARQMGKTNLLFNAKRTLENDQRLFVYVDLSNVFKFERDCYRNIIDCIIEPNEELFFDIIDDIDAIRINDYPPHKEHDRCLRKILKQFDGKIVIILDEIDALSGEEYSGNIFAQIRSNYFLRTNFPDFERLTYILSGVIEPTELIKDKNKSPFNIGEKMYLDDFSKDEYLTFIKNCSLNISEEVCERIYMWTNGNPRLTFDLCSDVESILIEKSEVNVSKINDLVKEKYLTNFDISPIDHIRELVKSNKNIRKAILAIIYNKSLSVDMKKKLYLYGIIGSDFNVKPVIKNLIVKSSLREDWLNEIEKANMDLMTYGLEKVENNQYQEAIKSLSEYLEVTNSNYATLEICYYNLGFSHFQLREYEKAKEYFEFDFRTDPYKRNKNTFIGTCYIGLGNSLEGKRILEGVIETEVEDFAFRSAIFNLAPIISEESTKKAIELYERLFNSIIDTDDSISENKIQKMKTVARFKISELLYKDDMVPEAIIAINESLSYSNISYLPYLTFMKFMIQGNDDIKLIRDIVNAIINNNVKFEKLNEYSIGFSYEYLLICLELTYSVNEMDLFDELLTYSSKNLFDFEKNKYEIVFDIFLTSENKVEISDYLIKNKIYLNDEILYKLYKSIIFTDIYGSDTVFKIFDSFLEIFERVEKVNVEDVYLFAFAIKKYYESSLIDKSFELCNIIEKKFLLAKSESLTFELSIVYYWFAVLHFSNKKVIESKKYAQMALEILTKFKEKSTSFIDEKGIEHIVSEMKNVILWANENNNISIRKKYGRNEKIKVKYIDGTIVVNKFKKLIDDIKAEKCVVFEE